MCQCGIDYMYRIIVKVGVKKRKQSSGISEKKRDKLIAVNT